MLGSGSCLGPSLSWVMASDRSKKSEAPALPRPPVFALPPTKSSPPARPSIAPPAPPPVPALAPTVSHELFDVDAAAVDHARDAVARRAAERASARPHPPRKSFKPGDLPPAVGTKSDAPAPNVDSAQRLSTPLSWAAAKHPALEEAPEDLLEPVVDSAPLSLPPISTAEPLASAIPMGSVVTPPPPKASERHWGALSVAALAAVGLVAAGSVLGAGQGESDDLRSGTQQTEFATNAMPAPSPPATALELDLGVPLSPPEEPKTETATDPSAVPPVAPSGVLPTRPPEVDKPPFDQQAAAQALSQAAQAALSCRKEGDPSGSATVMVRYAPSGRVTSATVEAGPFAGTVTGGCIATTFRKALIPAFSGDYMTVKRTVSFR
jgi:hypothetical protein